MKPNSAVDEMFPEGVGPYADEDVSSKQLEVGYYGYDGLDGFIWCLSYKYPFFRLSGIY